MMNELDNQRFNEAYSHFENGKYAQALQGIRDLASGISDPWEKAELLYHEVIFLLEMHKISEARQGVLALNKTIAALIQSPTDGNEFDLRISLPVMARHAEIRVTSEEGREPEALQLIEDFVSRYPKQLSMPEFRTMSDEITTLRGFLLGNSGRWAEAMPFLEQVPPPEAWRSYHSYYLGRCYCELHEYGRAKEKLVEALNLGLPGSWAGKAHYHLGIAEYQLSNMNAAKRQFDLSLKTADEEFLGNSRIWEWLEATCRNLGLSGEAENFRTLRTGLPTKTKVN
jgi:tetratricopeptide (TPR) repeat protein